jgi:hypothetical protein
VLFTGNNAVLCRGWSGIKHFMKRTTGRVDVTVTLWTCMWGFRVRISFVTAIVLAEDIRRFARYLRRNSSRRPRLLSSTYFSSPFIGHSVTDYSNELTNRLIESFLKSYFFS